MMAVLARKLHLELKNDQVMCQDWRLRNVLGQV